MKSRSLVPLLPTVVIAITIAMMLFSPAAGHAAASPRAYSVAPAGSDAASCSANSSTVPFATIQRALACAADGDTVDLAPTGADPYQGIGPVARNVTIEAQPGADARTVSIDAGKGELSVSPGVTVAVSGVNLSCPANDCAGAPTATDEGTLALTADQLTGNLGGRGAILQTSAAGSSAPAALSVVASTLSGNAATAGGAIDALPGAGATGALTLTVANSTIAGNYAQSVGGGISFNATTPGSKATIEGSTITANTAQAAGGGLSATGSVLLANTILTANTSRVSRDPDCQDEGFPNSTHVIDGPGANNLIGNVTGCGGLAGSANGDVLDATHPGLLPIADNGGPTDTVAVQAGSPALGAGDPATCVGAAIGDRDQRGVARNTSLRGCDIGAYDTAGDGGTVGHPYFVAPGGSDGLSCPANASTSPFATIQRALACSVDGDIVELAPTGTQPYPGVGPVTHNVTVQAQPGAGARTVSIDAGQGELSVAPGVNAAVSGVNLSCPANDCLAAPIATDEGALTLTADQLTGNLNGHGAILETTPAGSTTPASLRVLDSTVSENAAVAGGAVDALPGAGASGSVTLVITNSTVAGNHAQSVGGGISFNATTAGSSAEVDDTTIAGNTAQSAGGGLSATGQIALANTVLAANTSRVGIHADCQDEGFPQGTHVIDGPAGHDLVGVADGCPGIETSDDGDRTGSPEAPLNPELGPLAYNDGGTETLPLLAGSPAIGSAAATACESLTVASRDERGLPRNASKRGVCDIGSYDTAGRRVVARAATIRARSTVKATESRPIEVKIKAKGTPVAVLSESGALPNGLRFVDRLDGTASISGTPAPGSAGTYAVVLTATNAVAPSASFALTITVRP
jgi:hypothetical protein